MPPVKKLTLTVVTEDDKTIDLVSYEGCITLEYSVSHDIKRISFDDSFQPELCYSGTFDFSLKAHGSDDKLAADELRVAKEHYGRRRP